MTKALENVADVYVLSPLQEGMLFHTISDPASDVFINQISVRIDADLDVDLFQSAWNVLVDRHDTLRTAFIWDGLDQPVQVVRQTVQLNWALHDISGAADRPQALEAVVADQRHGFDLASAPLMRMGLVRLGPTEWRWVWTFHHIILDGWSAQVLIGELRALYAAGAHRTEPPMLPRPFRFGRYIGWGRERSSVADELFWSNYLAGFTTPQRLEVPGLAPGPGASGYETRHYGLDSETTSRLAGLAAAERVTLNAVVSGAWALIQARWARQRDVLFGITTSGRPAELPGVEDAVGLFINTLPLRLDVQPDIDIKSWLRQVHRAQLEVREREHVPLSSIQRWSDLGPGEALFETLFVFENYPPAHPDRNDEPAFGEMDFIERSNYPLAVLAVPGDELSLIFVFDASIVTGEAIDSLASQLVTALRCFGSNPETPLSGVSIVSEEEELAAVSLGMGPEAVTEDECVHQIIERIARTTPDKPAVVDADRSMSYAELFRLARELAGRLQKAGIGPNRLVGLYLERSIEMIVAIVGVLEAGGAYVPLDPEYPTAHIHALLENAGIEVVVSSKSLSLETPEGITSVLVDGEPETETSYSPTQVAPEDLAYVIHTSGSSGPSKGVMVSHRNLVTSTMARQDHYGAPVSRFLLLSSFAFDSSLVGIFWTICTGGTIVLPAPRLEQDMQRLLSLVEQHRVTHLLALPALYELMLEEASAGQLESLEVAIVAGEACPPRLVASHWDALPETELHNEYGPTEATVWCTVHRTRRGDTAGNVPIGRPIAGAEVRLLDQNGHWAPLGFPGELWVGGDGVAQGYLGRRDLTEERFQNLDSQGVGKRFYRTGDLAAFAPDGQLLFLGRSDTQLKIRGHRIEAGAVESEIRSHPEIDDAAVTTQSSPGRGGDRLVAYAVPADSSVDLTVVRDHLRSSLPDFMVPEIVVPLPELPRLPNGKVDLNALPDPLALEGDTGGHVPPRDQAEDLLAAIWSELLGTDRIGVTDDYFALGGDSIISIQMISRARRAGLHVEPSDLTADPTIAGLMAAVRRRDAPTSKPHAMILGNAPLSPIQRWFFDQEVARPDHWNQSRLFEMATDTNVDRLRETLVQCVAHHDMLRARFVEGDDGWRQDVAARSDVELQVIEAESPDHLERVITEAQASLNLGSGPVFRALLIRRRSESPLLLLVVHHLVIDLISWAVLVDDIERGYHHRLRGEDLPLDPTGASYRDWVDWLSKEQQSDELTFWAEQRSRVEVPKDHPADGYGLEGSQETVTISLGPEETSALLTSANDAYQTRPEELVTAALTAALSRWLDSTRVELAMEGHGRPTGPGAPDVTRTLGWFTALYPLAFDLDTASDRPGLIKLVKERLRSVPDGGVGYGVLRHLQGHSELVGCELPPILFNYLGRGLTVTSRMLMPSSEIVNTSKSSDNQRLHLLEIVAAIDGGVLRVDWHFSTTLHETDTIKEVTAMFEAELRQVIEHCTAEGTGGFTPSDFPDAGFDQDELDQFLEGLT